MPFLRKMMPAAYAAFLLGGLMAVLAIGTYILFLADSSGERALTWDEIGIISAAEEDALAKEQAKNIPVVPVGLTNASNFDGPALAASMVVDSKTAWLSWMQENRPDKPDFLGQRWDLAATFIASGELKRTDDVRAFLLAPREHFIRERNKGFEYADTWLPIGWGATITDPDVVAMMTTTLNIQATDKVLEIGTGSGYQSAILSYLSNNIYTIEIIAPLFRETDALYTNLGESYPSYNSIHRKLGDGYYGWEEYAPFDKIIVTCSIDHIPPPLLQQLKTGGIMVLPLGPPGRQYIMEIKKSLDSNGHVTLARRDVYNGLWVSFIPFRNEAGTAYNTSKPYAAPKKE